MIEYLKFAFGGSFKKTGTLNMMERSDFNKSSIFNLQFSIFYYPGFHEL